MKSIQTRSMMSIAAAGIALVVTPTWADEYDVNPRGWYGSLEGAYSQLLHSSVSLNTAPLLPVDPTHALRFSAGYAGLGGLGYKFNDNMRLELELGYRRNDVRSMTGYTGVNGRASGFSQMMNALYDADLGPRLLAYGGIGIGGVDVSVKAQTNGVPLLNGDDYTLGYQALAGLAYRVTPPTYLYLDYHYLSAVGAHISSGSFNQTPKVRFQDHVIGAGLRMYFNAPPAAPAKPMPPQPVVAQAPPPPPKPAAVIPAPRAFLVFFDFDRAEITPEARRIIDSAIEWAKKSQSLKITVTGHTDTMGTASYNQALSIRRAQAVKSVIMSAGYRDGDISIDGKGFSQPLVATGPQVKEPQNRRAEITMQ